MLPKLPDDNIKCNNHYFRQGILFADIHPTLNIKLETDFAYQLEPHFLSPALNSFLKFAKIV